jgi:hypothetical protein
MNIDNTHEPRQNIHSNMNPTFFSGKNFIIIILSGLLILSFLGINLLNVLGNMMDIIINIFGPLITQLLSIFGYTAGTVLDKSSDAVTNVAKTGLDVANGTVQSVADLLKNASKKGVDNASKQQLDDTLNQSLFKNNEPEHDSSVNPIQKPITASKNNWCLVGEYEGKRGCIEVNDDSNCMSGQTFSSRELCMNPTRTLYTNP